MSGFIKVGGVTMSDDQVCEILFNSEDVAYDSTDTEGASDTEAWICQQTAKFEKNKYAADYDRK